jgi:hypothetical protein
MAKITQMAMELLQCWNQVSDSLIIENVIEKTKVLRFIFNRLELRRVQQLVGDMQRQRQELSQAVRELTDNSNSIYNEMNRNTSGIKKRSASGSWTETDLDSLNNSRISLNESGPLYIETASSNNSSANIMNCSTSSKVGDFNGRLSNGFTEEIIDSMTLDNDEMEGSNFTNLNLNDKQEIKTVRIVKRESQQRQRERDRTGFLTQNLDQVLEEEAQLYKSAINSDSFNAYQRSKSLPRGYETHEVFNQNQKHPNDYYNAVSMQNGSYPISMIDRAADLYSDSANNSQQIENRYANYYSQSQQQQQHQQSNGTLTSNHKAESIQSLTKMVGELSPVFTSEAARQIINEMSSGASGDDDPKMPNAVKQRRAVPKEKRRHFTAPHHVNAKTVQTIQQAENDMNKNVRTKNTILYLLIKYFYIPFFQFTECQLESKR